MPTSRTWLLLFFLSLSASGCFCVKPVLINSIEKFHFVRQGHVQMRVEPSLSRGYQSSLMIVYDGERVGLDTVTQLHSLLPPYLQREVRMCAVDNPNLADYIHKKIHRTSNSSIYLFRHYNEHLMDLELPLYPNQKEEIVCNGTECHRGAKVPLHRMLNVGTFETCRINSIEQLPRYLLAEGTRTLSYFHSPLVEHVYARTLNVSFVVLLPVYEEVPLALLPVADAALELVDQIENKVMDVFWDELEKMGKSFQGEDMQTIMRSKTTSKGLSIIALVNDLRAAHFTNWIQCMIGCTFQGTPDEIARDVATWMKDVIGGWGDEEVKWHSQACNQQCVPLYQIQIGKSEETHDVEHVDAIQMNEWLRKKDIILIGLVTEAAWFCKECNDVEKIFASSSIRTRGLFDEISSSLQFVQIEHSDALKIDLPKTLSTFPPCPFAFIRFYEGGRHKELVFNNFQEATGFNYWLESFFTSRVSHNNPSSTSSHTLHDEL